MNRQKQTKKDKLAADYVRAAADGALRTEFMRQTENIEGKDVRDSKEKTGTSKRDSWKRKEGSDSSEEIYSDIEVKADRNDETVELDAGRYSLIPSGRLVDEDDMRHLASLQEEFSQAMDPILRLYNAAMNVTATRMSIIKDEFKFRGKRNPIHHIDTRLKSSESILHKLEKKGFELSINSMANNIYDIAGVRVICSYIKDVYLVRDRILDQDDLVIMEIKDYIENPKPNGYRSLHMIVRVPVYFMNKKQMVPVEIQIRTEAMDMWASLEHDIKYKSLYQDIGVDFTSELLEASQLIYKAEEKMEYMNDILEE